NKERVERKSPERLPHSLDDVVSLFTERGYRSDPESFYNYFQANGWVQGKSRAPIKDWKAAASNWEKREKEFAAERAGPVTNKQNDSFDVSYLDDIAD
ncbi:MAG: hypothetical protein Q4C42_11755, partial [Clostridia bacterium]|nr:hypothetical protein [Clostridia bacterium]